MPLFRFRAAGRRHRTASVVLALLSILLLPILAARAGTLGEQKTAVLLVNFADRPAEPISAGDAYQLVFGTVGDFYWEGSYHATFLAGDVFGWFTVPVSSQTCDVQSLASEADQAAAASGVDLARYDRLVYLAPQNSCTVTGYHSGTALPSRTWVITDWPNARVIAHELGHNFGLSHSQALDCGAATMGEDCINRSYGDAADTMGSGSTPHFNAFQKENLGWLGAAGQPAITSVAQGGRYAIAPLSSASGGSRALKIPRGIDALTGEASYYYVEYRQPDGFDAVLGNVGNLTQGVLVHTGGADQYSMLLDMTPDSDPSSSYHDINDSALTAGRTFADAGAGIAITLVSADAAGAVVDVELQGSAGGGVALAASVATDKASYRRGEVVRISARVEGDGVAVADAVVSLQLTRPDGGVTVLDAVSDDNGYARVDYRLPKGKPAIGGYALKATANAGGSTATAGTGFEVH